MKQWLRSLLSEVGLAPYLVPAFRFQCDCGKNIIGPIPEEGTIIRPVCECGIRFEMTWIGTRWRLVDLDVTSEPAQSGCKGADADFEEALNVLRKQKV